MNRAKTGAKTGAKKRRVAPVVVWVARVGWVLVAAIGGAAIEAAVTDRSAAVRWVCAIGGWTSWAVVALALAVPSVRSLTVARIVAPLSVVVGIAAAIAGTPATELLLLGVTALAAVAAMFTPEFGLAFVQASAYGDEDRFPLRAPAATGAAAVITWLAWAPAIVAAAPLLAARSWVIGGIASFVAIGGAVYLAPRWHRLSQRWLVLVPAGLVVRDPVVLAETLMLRSGQIASIALARAGTEAADLTGPASGYALEVSTTETVSAVFAFSPSEPNGKSIHMTAFLVSPSRPGRTLEVAAARGLPVA